MWGKLSHPFILAFLGIFECRGHLYLISPFIQRGCLPAYLEAHPNADRQRLVRLQRPRFRLRRQGILQIHEIVDGLAYLHDQSTVHGDIKGANILVSHYHHALLCDFGLAKMADARTSSSLAGAGSLRWQAPELFDRTSRTAMSDMYAFGITIAEVSSPFHSGFVRKLTRVLIRS